VPPVPLLLILERVGRCSIGRLGVEPLLDACRPRNGERLMTMVGWSLFSIAVGAILKWAVTGHLVGIRVHTVGVILMLTGLLGLCIGLFLLYRNRSEYVQ
jgi:hypothetical protein